MRGEDKRREKDKEEMWTKGKNIKEEGERGKMERDRKLGMKRRSDDD